jgi:NAD(P)-dependent dehydrogenase (short-subunit alcohol dehydrogenase family)
LRLKDRIALITGGGRGIGRAIALAFAREGASVIVASRTISQVASVAEEIKQTCQVATHAISCDVADAGAVSLMFEEADALFGRRPDILVNNAGIAESAPLLKTTDELWHRHLDINLSGTFYCTRAALPQMTERGWGRIINVASIAGKTGAPYISAYSASKHGVLGLTRSVALETATRGVTVNAICPGYVETDMTGRAIENIQARTGRSEDDARAIIEGMSPQNRLVTAEEVAALALLLASEEGRGITGQAINIDGGSLLY